MATELPHQPQVKSIHFFKIILAQSLHEGKLMIPRKFVEKYGEGLPKTIFLKPPKGAEWKLNLVKREGKIWFEKGWKEFAEYHSLAHGHLLVFRYQGTSHFQVHIFDKSALEINYPFKRAQAKRASNGQKRKANSSLEFLQPCKMGSSRCVPVGNTLKLQKVALHKHITDRKCKGKQIITAEQVTALDRASSFKTCNPSFIVVMHPSYVTGSGSLNLPSKFVKRHLDLGKKQVDIHLGVLDGRVWPARYAIWKTNKGKKIKLSGGWKAFVKDNNLKVGDVCTFELILGNKFTFLVHIFKKTDNSTCSTSQKSSQMRQAV